MVSIDIRGPLVGLVVCEYNRRVGVGVGSDAWRV